jgi:glycerol-3-phosphate dehydrogenase
MTKVAIIGNGVWGGKIENCIKDSVQFVEPNDAEWRYLWMEANF